MFFRRLKFVWKKKCHISQQNDDRCGKQSKALAFQSEDLINLFIFHNLNFDFDRFRKNHRALCANVNSEMSKYL